MNMTLDNAIYVSDKAKAKVLQLMEEGGFANDPAYFLRVSVVGGGCSGLSYKLDFDNQQKSTDQVFPRARVDRGLAARRGRRPVARPRVHAALGHDAGGRQGARALRGEPGG